MKKIFSILLLIIAATQSRAAVYYVSGESFASDGNAGTSPTLPWRSNTKVSSFSSSLQPGDVVYYRRGYFYPGTLTINKSGTASAFITFSAYGTGTDPVFVGTGATIPQLVYTYNRTYLIFESLQIIDTSMINTNRSQVAKIQIGMNLDTTRNCIIRGCRFERIGVGIFLQAGSNNQISYNSFVNLRMVRSDAGTDNDYGANGIVMSSGSNIVSRNSFVGCWANSVDYTFDGGAVEVYGPYSNNQVVYNYIFECLGVCEFGSGSGGISQNTLVAYNIIVNCGGTYANMSGTFAIQAKTIRYYNNVLVDSANPWGSIQDNFFSYGGTAAADTVFDVRNNIFYSRTGMRVKKGGWPDSKIVHKNNIYALAGGSVIGYTVDPSEIVSNANNWVRGATLPKDWNYNLISTAPAAKQGQSLGGLFTVDYALRTITDPPSIGPYEPNDPTPPPVNPPGVYKTRFRVLKQFP